MFVSRNLLGLQTGLGAPSTHGFLRGPGSHGVKVQSGALLWYTAAVQAQGPELSLRSLEDGQGDGVR